MRKTERKKKNLWLLLAFGLLFYAVLIWSINEIGQRIDPPPESQNYGDLSERFPPKHAVEYNGQIYEYREHELVNILLLGIDSRDGAQTEEGRFGDQADFILLLTVDKQNKNIIPIHIDRDTMTKVRIYGAFGDPAGSRVTQICLAQAFHSDAEKASQNTVKAVSELFAEIPIDYYVTMNLDGIAELNNALGGVTVTLEDDFSQIDPSMQKGETICLKGVQAEIFVRNRTDVSDGTNAMRMRRQRIYMDAAMDILLKNMEEDLNFVGELYDQLEPQLVTNMERGFLANEAYKYSKYTREEITSLAGNHVIGSDGFVEFYPDQEALNLFVLDTFFKK